MTDEKTTFTLVEAAELLSCHTATLRRAIQDGELRAARVGKRFRVSKTDLEDFWIARGGGALFEDSPRPPLEPKKAQKEKGKKRQGPEQLKLPT